MAVDPQVQAQWQARMAADPEFQRLYAAYKTGDARASYDFNKYLSKVLPKGMAWDGSQGVGLKDRSASPWTAPLAAAAGVATMGLGAGGVLGGLFGGSGASGGASAATSAAGAAGSGAATGATGMGGLLGKIGSGALGFLKSGSTGNSIADAIIGGVGQVGRIAGDTAADRAEGREREDNALVQRDRLGMESASRNIAGDSARMRQLALIDLMSGGLQDATVTPPAHIAERMGQVSGGARPSALKATGASLGGDVRARILQSLLSGQHMPELSEMPEANGFDNALGWLGTGGAFLGALGGGGKKQPVAPTPGVDPGRLIGQLPQPTFRTQPIR